MNAIEATAGIPEEVRAQLQQTLDDLEKRQQKTQSPRE